MKKNGEFRFLNDFIKNEKEKIIFFDVGLISVNLLINV